MSTALEYQCLIPNKGIVANKPEELLSDSFSPESRNMQFLNELLQSRGGLSKFNSTALPDRVLTIANFKDVAGVQYLIFATKRDIVSYDFGNARFDYLTPLYQVGKILVTNGSTKVYGGLEIDNCDVDPVAWADGSGGDVTPSRTTTSGEFKEGTAGVKLDVASGAGVELLAYHNISSTDLHTYDSCGFWFKSSVDLDAGDLQFLLDDTSACASPLETIDFPAITADTWTWVPLAFADPSLLTAVASIGIKQAVDKGAMLLYIDQIVAGDWSDQLKVGDFIKVGSGSVHSGSTWYEVASIDTDTSLTLTAAYAGSSAYQQAYVARETFSGGNNDYWDWDEFPDDNLGNVILLCNGTTNGFVYWTGSGQVGNVITNVGNTSGMTAAKYITVYGGRVHVAYTVEGGQTQRARQRWSDPLNCVSWLASDFNDFTDEPTSISGLTKFNGYQVTYKDSQAYVGRFVGGDDIFSWEISPQAFGARSGYSIVTRNDWIYYYAHDKKFHRFNLLQDDIISEPLFPETKNFDPNQDAFIQGYNVTIFNEIRWFCPSGSTTTFNYTFVWNYQENVPEVWVYTHTSACCCMGSYIRTSDVYADDPIYGNQYADETGGYADDSSFLSGSAIVIYGGYDGYIRIADGGTSDDGNSFTSYLRLKRQNFMLLNKIKRLWKAAVWVTAQPTGTLTVRMKLDGAISFRSDSKTIDLTTSEGKDILKQMVTFNMQAQNFQIELTSESYWQTLGIVFFYFKNKRSYLV